MTAIGPPIRIIDVINPEEEEAPSELARPLPKHTPKPDSPGD